MFKNYLTTAIRNLLRNRFISAINLSGLAIGMAGAALLAMNIVYQLNVDSFHKNRNFLYRVYNREVVDGQLSAWNATPAPLGPVLKKDFSFIEKTCRIVGSDQLITVGDKKIRSRGNFVDPSFLTMFSFPLLQGEAGRSLEDVNSIVVSEELAIRLFGSNDVVGKILTLENRDQLKITGVLKNLPPNTDFRFEFLIPWALSTQKGWESKAWDNNYVATYVQLNAGNDVKRANKEISTVTQRYSKTEKVELFLHPFKSEFLYNRFENGQVAGGRIENVRFMGILGFVILLIACINFMNLATARSEKRAREVGVRKVLGAERRNLVTQFIGESVVMAFFGAVIATVIILLVMPGYNAFANVELTLPYKSAYFWVSALAFIVFTGVLAGSYPAFFLSSFKAINVLKGVLKNGNALVTPRKVLVIVQFALAVVLINFTIVFRKQVNHTENRDPGFIKENLVFHSVTSDLEKNYEVMKNELISSHVAISVTRTNTPIMWSAGSLTGLEWEGKDVTANSSFELITTDADFIRTNGLKMLAGRELDIYKRPADTSSCMINETAARVMGLKDPVGKVIKGGSDRTIVGVVSDFLSVAPNQATRPVYIEANKQGNFINLRLAPGMTNIKKAQAIVEKYNRGFITDLLFADAEHDRKFRQARNAAILINTFAAIAIFISCLGLFGLSVYMAENRTREIGIRKVLGATVAGIVVLLTRQFVRLVLLAVAIATPLAWLLMNFFLRSFEYRTTLSTWVPVLSAAIAIFIAVLTVSVQSLKAGAANPTKSLRSE